MKMKKRIATLFVAVVLMFAMAIPVMAIDGLVGEVQSFVAVNRVMQVEDLDSAEDCCMMTPFNELTCVHGFTRNNCPNVWYHSPGCRIQTIWNYYLNRPQDVRYCPWHRCW